MSKRIGYLVPEFPGQTHTWIWRECRALEEAGFEVDLVSTRRPKVACHSWSGEAMARTHYLSPPDRAAALGALRALRRGGASAVAECLQRWLRAEDLDWRARAKLLAMLGVGASLAHRAQQRDWAQLHVLSCGDAAMIANFASVLSGVPYSITLLAPLEGYGPNQRLKWGGAAFGLVMSERLLRELREALGPDAPERLVIAPMGVDLEQARRAAPYRPCQPGETARLYTCGRLHPVKGHTYLLDALARLSRQGRPVRLEVAGGEEGCAGYAEELRQQIAAAGLTAQVAFLGPVTEEAHRQALEKAHVFVLASLDEGISVAAMEAMALETPAVVTDVGGMRELVEPGVDALMVPARDPQALADAIASILSDPARASALSQASRQKVARSFHHRRGAQAMAELLGPTPLRTPAGDAAVA